MLVSNPVVLNSLQTAVTAPYVPVTRHYTLIIEGADIPEGTNATWHAWTYNGTVPGPTLYAYVGDMIQVTVYNHLNLIHSFHTHLVNYNFSSDGSQANVIVGMGAGGMIAPGQSYTYDLNATYAGIFYYHCHSADKFPISYHIAQGLYGIILVDDPNKPLHLADDFVVAMGETGPQVTGTAPPYIMDGKAFPGGEQALMNLYAAQGLSGVEATFNKTLLTFEAKVGETIRFDVINVGELVHSFHLHDAELISEFQNPGVPVPDAVIPLDPATADSVFVTLTQPGVFLFHCHVVEHADAGMIGVLVVLPANGSVSRIPSTPLTTYSLPLTTNTSTVTITTLTVGAQVQILPNAAANQTSLGFSPNIIHVVLGVNNTVTWTNNDIAAHTVTANDGSFDSGEISPGQTFSHTFTSVGTYAYHCSYHSWMSGTVIVSAG
jgi:manganese oxidase